MSSSLRDVGRIRDVELGPELLDGLVPAAFIVDIH